jgi:hypothetical protein
MSGRRTKRRTRFVLWLAGMLTLSGCSSVSPPVVQQLTDAARQEIHRRALGEFGHVSFFKPGIHETTSGAIKLAPLILEQMSESKRDATQLEADRIVWSYPSRAEIQGRDHEQRVYFWEQQRAASAVSYQGIRITLNPAGDPSIWEVLNDSKGAEIIWVSQSLEIAAAKEFGPALAGRLCSVERALSETPRVVVPHLVDDGPMPMGPILYIAEGGDIHVVACRCSAAPAQTLEAQGVYRLEEISPESAEQQLRSGPAAQSWFDPGRLETRLRLPKEF